MIFRDPDLRLQSFFKQDVGLRQRAKQRQIRYYRLARQALGAAADCLGIQRGDSVLLPAYICKEAVMPFKQRGIKVIYYHINRNFHAEINDLEKKRDNKTKAIIWVNYFGLMNNAKDYKEFCQKRGLYFIEDNAHSLMLDLNQTHGDISVFSLRKFYPAADGAMLVYKDGLKFEDKKAYYPINPVWTMDDYKFITGKMLRKGYALFANEYFNKILLNYKKDGGTGKFLEDDELKVSRSSLKILNSVAMDEVYHHRRFNYQMLKSHLFVTGSSVYIPFQNLTDHSAPLAFPVLVSGDREKFIRRVFLKGFVVYGWSDLPEEVLNHDNFPIENELAKQMVLLPIHQSMSEKNIIELAQAVREASGEAGPKV